MVDSTHSDGSNRIVGMSTLDAAMVRKPVAVLLLEDEEHEYQRLQALFAELPEGAYHLDRVADFASVLHAFEHCVHDLYLVDYRIGDRNGLEILDEARRRNCLAPMILLADERDRDVDLTAMQAGAVDYLVKSQLDVHRLERSLRYAMEHARRRYAADEARRHLEERIEQHSLELRTSRERLDLVVHATDIGLWFSDLPDGQTEWNAGCKKLFGLPVDVDVTPAMFFDHVHPDDRGRVQAAIDATIREGVDYDVSYRVSAADVGGPRWLRSIGRRFCSEDGTPRRFDGVTIDITSQKQAEQDLAESQRFLSSVVNALPGQIAVLNEAGFVIAVNEAWNRLAQTAATAGHFRAVGENYLEAFATPPEQCDLSPDAAAAIRNVLDGRSPHFTADYSILLDGRRRYFQIRATPFAHHGAMRVVVVHNDITERSESDQTLRHRSGQLQELAKIAAQLNAAHDVVAVLNTLTHGACEIIGAHQGVTNHKIGRDWGQSVNVVVLSDKYGPWHNYKADIDGTGIYALVCRTGRAMRLTQEELERHPAWRNFGTESDDHPPLRGWLAAPLVGRDGRNLGVVQLSDRYDGEFTAEDEAILVQMAQMASVALENAFLYRDLRDADRRKDQFLATLAHELRNPLSPLTAAAQLISLEPENSSQVGELTAVMSRQLDQLRRLIDDLLDVSRISSGKLMLRNEPVLLHEAVSAAVDVSRPLFENSKHVLRLVSDAQPMVVFGDKVRLAQIVGNLLINSAKYTPQGGRIELETTAEAGFAVVRVSDNGIGIAPDMLERIFGLFTQIDSSNTRAQGGLGIGLTLVKTLVEMHGGTIDAQSPGPGLGSTFTVRLPLADPALASVKPPEPDPEIVLPSYSVLVVDDNHSAAYLLSRLLEKLQQRVAVAHSAGEAADMVLHLVPDILISDIAMPGESGYDLAARVRKMKLAKPPILIALTGYGQESDRQQALASGFDLHLTKPIGLPALKRLLQRIAEGRRS